MKLKDSFKEESKILRNIEWAKRKVILYQQHIDELQKELETYRRDYGK